MKNFKILLNKQFLMVIHLKVILYSSHTEMPEKLLPPVSGKCNACKLLTCIILILIFRALDKREYLMIIKDILLILHKNICCDPSSEPSQQDGSDEGSQHMVLMRNNKKYLTIIII